jgi:accessory gene regulator protein AgrB
MSMVVMMVMPFFVNNIAIDNTITVSIGISVGVLFFI